MANQIEATIYQIDGNPQAAPITVSFLTSELVIQEALISTIPAVQSAIYYYNVVNNQQSVQTYYAGENVATLVALANNGETSHTQATVLEINGAPQIPGGVQYSFPSAAILIGESINPTTGVNAFIQYKGIKYYTAETQATLYNNSNAGGGGGIIVVGSGLNSSVRCGNNNSASGDYSTAFGRCNSALGNNTLVGGGCCNSAGTSNVTWCITSSTYSGIYADTFSGYFTVSCWAANGSSVAVTGDQSGCSACLPATLSGVQYSTGTYSCYETGSGVSGCNVSSITYDAISDTTTFCFTGNLSPTSFTVLGNCGSVVVGGNCNTTCGSLSFTGGGLCNTTSGGFAFTGSGNCNTSSGNNSFTGSGYKNTTSGSYSFTGGGLCNTTCGSLSFTGSGYKNTTSGSSSFTGGGCCNITTGGNSFTGGGFCNVNQTGYSVIGGGQLNNICIGSENDWSVISGGVGNTICGGRHSAIAGGCNNLLMGVRSTISGGYCNRMCSNRASMVGGCANLVCSGANGTFSGGGVLNTNGAGCGFLGGGSSNTNVGVISAMVAGRLNSITSSASYSFHGAGRSNTVSNPLSASVGGQGNTISGACSFNGGGVCNIASGNHSFTGSGRINSSVGEFSTTVGGCKNLTQSVAGFIGGGICNNVCNVTSGCLAIGAVVVGGVGNNTTGGTWSLASCSFTVAPTICNAGQYSFVGGGFQNIVSGDFAFTGGGCCNIASGIASAVVGGAINTTNGCACAMIIGSNITADRVCATFVNNLSIKNIPISSAGLPSGSVWSDSGTLKIV